MQTIKFNYSNIPPSLIEHAIAFGASFKQVLQTYRSTESPTFEDTIALCRNMYRNEYQFVFDLLQCIGDMQPSRDDELLFVHLQRLIDVPEMFCPELIKNTASSSECTGLALAVRMELYNALLRGATWFVLEPPRFTVGVLGELASYIQEWLRCHAAPPTALKVSLPENNEQMPHRDIPRSQRIALLYTLLIRFGVPRVCSAKDIAMFIEAVTGGNIVSDGRNTYSAKHLHDMLRPDIQYLIDIICPRK